MPTFEFLSLCWAEHFVTTCFSTLTYSNFVLFVVCCFSGISFNLKWQLSLSVCIIISTPYCRGKKASMTNLFSQMYSSDNWLSISDHQAGKSGALTMSDMICPGKREQCFSDEILSWLCWLLLAPLWCEKRCSPLLAVGEPSCCHQFLGRLLFLSTSVISAPKAVPAVCVEKELFTFWVHLRTYRSAGVIISRCPSL